MENYISTVLSKIRDEKLKADIQAELEDHYNERVEYYTRIGYDQETAETKANEHFGNEAEIIGEQLDSMNTNNTKANVVYTVVNVLFIVIIIWAAFGASLLDMPFAFDFGGSTLIIVFTLFSFAELFIALRKKSAYMSGLGAVGMGLSALLFTGFSPTVFGIYKFLKGEMGRYLDLMLNYNWKSANTAVNILSLIFYLFCIGLFVYAAILSQKFKQCKYKKQHIKQEKCLKLITAITATIVFLSLVFIFITPPDYRPVNNVEGFYVIESDEKVDPSQIENYDYNFLSIDWDFGDEYPYDRNDAFVDTDIFQAEINVYDDDTDIVYNTLIVYGEYQPTKKYVCMIPVKEYVNGNGAVFDDYEWVDTSQEYLFASDYYTDLGSIVQYKIKVLPKEAV